MQYKTYLIYHMLEDGNRIPVYAGLTTLNLLDRFRCHFSSGKGLNPAEKLAYFTAHKEHLEPQLHGSYSTKEEMLEAEKALIKWLKAEALKNGWPNFNRSDGGEYGMLGLCHSRETRLLMSESTKRAYDKPGAREKTGASSKEMHSRPDVKQRHKAAMKVAMSSPEARAVNTFCVNTAEAKASQAAYTIKRFGAVYPGTTLERIRGIVPIKSLYAINMTVHGELYSISGYKTPLEAVPGLHSMQKKIGRPLSIIPPSYNYKKASQ